MVQTLGRKLDIGNLKKPLPNFEEMNEEYKKFILNELAVYLGKNEDYIFDEVFYRFIWICNNSDNIDSFQEASTLLTQDEELLSLSLQDLILSQLSKMYKLRVSNVEKDISEDGVLFKETSQSNRKAILERISDIMLNPGEDDEDYSYPFIRYDSTSPRNKINYFFVESESPVVESVRNIIMDNVNKKDNNSNYVYNVWTIQFTELFETSSLVTITVYLKEFYNDDNELSEISMDILKFTIVFRGNAISPNENETEEVNIVAFPEPIINY